MPPRPISSSEDRAQLRNERLSSVRIGKTKHNFLEICRVAGVFSQTFQDQASRVLRQHACRTCRNGGHGDSLDAKVFAPSEYHGTRRS
jgi:hypothetical protein